MILADDIAAARGTINDGAGFFTSLHNAIQKSHRFVLKDDVAISAYRLVRSRPSSMLAAMPLCRLPYRSIWIEWSGGISERAGWQIYPAIERGKEDIIRRVNPIRMGCLIETLDETYQRGQMTWAWLHPEEGMNGSPLSVNFDWTENGNIESAARAAGVDTGDAISRIMFKRYIERPASFSEAIVKDVLETHSGWSALRNDNREIAALSELLCHEAVWISRHGRQMIDLLMSDRDPKYIIRCLSAWEGDISGEAPFIDCLLMMMNSRNAVEHSENDLSRLNRAREKRGKPPLHSHNVTSLYMSRHRRAMMANGLRVESRGTDVMGHFKIRKSGVWWWNEHWRGDRDNPMPRENYEIKP